MSKKKSNLFLKYQKRAVQKCVLRSSSSVTQNPKKSTWDHKIHLRHICMDFYLAGKKVYRKPKYESIMSKKILTKSVKKLQNFTFATRALFFLTFNRGAQTVFFSPTCFI